MKKSERLAYAQQIIEAYEQGALSSGSMAGMYASLNGPLGAMKKITDSSDEVMKRKPEDYGPSDDDNDELKINQLIEQYGNPESYLARCLNCNLRPLEPWELDPLKFANPLLDLMRQINLALDGLEQALDVTAPVKELCALLNAFRTGCLEELLIALMALKWYFRLEARRLFQLKLDWTAVFGPLLKVVFDVIGNLLGWAETMILNVLDCVIASITTVGNLQEAAGDLVGAVQSYAGNIGDVRQEVLLNQIKQAQDAEDAHDPFDLESADIDFDLNRQDLLDTTRNDETGFSLKAEATGSQGNENIPFTRTFGAGFETPTGFRLEELQLQEALKRPEWAEAGWATQITTALRTSRNEIQDFIDKFDSAVRSLQAMVGTGIQAQIEGTQTLMYIISLIRLFAVVIELIGAFPDIQDWCQQLEDDPEIINNALKERFPEFRFETTRVEGDEPGAAIIMSNSSRQIATIRGCSADRVAAESERVRQWIQQLKDIGAYQ